MEEQHICIDCGEVIQGHIGPRTKRGRACQIKVNLARAAKKNREAMRKTERMQCPCCGKMFTKGARNSSYGKVFLQGEEAYCPKCRHDGWCYIHMERVKEGRDASSLKRHLTLEQFAFYEPRPSLHRKKNHARRGGRRNG